MNGGRAILRNCRTLKSQFSVGNLVKSTPRIGPAMISRNGAQPPPISRNFSVQSTLMGSGSVGDGGTSVLTPELKDRIEKMVKETDVVVFMKGVPAEPRCGFSNAVAQIFRMHDIPITGHDVLVDEEVRQGIKEYSNWPTIPQVFFKGEFMGGCDIMIEMHQSGELIEELDKIGLKSALKTPVE